MRFIFGFVSSYIWLSHYVIYNPLCDALLYRREVNWIGCNWIEPNAQFYGISLFNAQWNAFCSISFGSDRCSGEHTIIMYQLTHKPSKLCHANLPAEPLFHPSRTPMVRSQQRFISVHSSPPDFLLLSTTLHSFIHGWHHLLLLLWPRWRRLKSLSVLVNEHALRIKMIAITHIPSCMYVDRHR